MVHCILYLECVHSFWIFGYDHDSGIHRIFEHHFPCGYRCGAFPFISKLEKLVCYLVKDSAEELEDEADFDLLEERLLNYPALAIGQCHRAMNGMAKKLRKNVNRAMNLLNDYQQDKYDKVQRKEQI